MVKIGFIGAGSVEFTRNVVADLCSFPELQGELHLALHDIDAERLGAGFDHQAFVLRFAREGEDLYPRLREIVEADSQPRRRVRVEIFRRFGYFPAESSEHGAEYVPWFLRHDTQVQQFRPDIALSACEGRREDDATAEGAVLHPLVCDGGLGEREYVDLGVAQPGGRRLLRCFECGPNQLRLGGQVGAGVEAGHGDACEPELVAADLVSPVAAGVSHRREAPAGGQQVQALGANLATYRVDDDVELLAAEGVR